MSNQVFSNTSNKYAVDSSDVNVGGQLLSDYLSPTAITIPRVQNQSGIFINVNSTDIIKYDTANNTIVGPRQIIKEFSGQTVNSSILSNVFTGLLRNAGTVSVQFQFVSVAGANVGAYGSYSQVTRFTNTTGNVIVGTNNSQSLNRDAPLNTASIILTGGADQLTVGLSGVIGETMNVTGVIIIYQ